MAKKKKEKFNYPSLFDQSKSPTEFDHRNFSIKLKKNISNNDTVRSKAKLVNSSNSHRAKTINGIKDANAVNSTNLKESITKFSREIKIALLIPLLFFSYLGLKKIYEETQPRVIAAYNSLFNFHVSTVTGSNFSNVNSILNNEINYFDIKDQIKEFSKIPWVKNISHELNLKTNSINIKIEEHFPIFTLIKGSEAWIVNEVGEIEEPLLIFSKKFKTPDLKIMINEVDHLDEKNSTALNLDSKELINLHSHIEKFLKLSEIKSDQIQINFNARSITVIGNPSIILPAYENNLQDLVEKLKIVLSDLNSRKERPKEIDFRFKDRVVVR